MHIADVIDTNQILSLISWCNNIIDCLPVDKVKLARSLWLISDMCSMFSVLHIYSMT